MEKDITKKHSELIEDLSKHGIDISFSVIGIQDKNGMSFNLIMPVNMPTEARKEFCAQLYEIYSQALMQSNELTEGPINENNIC